MSQDNLSPLDSISSIKDNYFNSTKIQKLIEELKKEEATIHLKGLVGSSIGFVASAVAKLDEHPQIFILQDKESAVYFYNTLENINTDKSSKKTGKKIFFYPASYKRPYQIEDTDNANVLLRTEVLNAISVYEDLKNYKPTNEKSFLKAHKSLLKNLIADAGKYRKQSVGIVKGTKVAHLAPPFENIPFLMKDLFDYLKTSEEIALIKSCVFHYEMEFIHPFLDGNGRMGRLWQTLILMEQYPVFEFIPFESLIRKNQDAYYKALSDSDKLGNSTKFIEYMLAVIDASLNDLLDFNSRIFTQKERLVYFISLDKNPFSRKEYMNVFKDISSATASRDLKTGVEKELFIKIGEKNKTKYFLDK